MCGTWSLAIALACGTLGSADLTEGPWQASLTSPGGRLPFGLELARADQGWQATLINGAERIAIPKVEVTGDRLILAMPHYDSEIRATVAAEGRELRGTWVRRTGVDQWARLPFYARAGRGTRTAPDGRVRKGLAGRWSVAFSKSDDPAVAIFHADDAGGIRGTFLTTTGDYRYLAGTLDADGMTLSCFDGAHAFLFRAKLESDGTLAGQFWSRDNWHETWIAQRDDNAQLPDAFAQTVWDEHTRLDQIKFRDLAGQWVSLADTRFQGKARIIQVFGSWCPNCHDAARYLTELHAKYESKGLSVMGLAFELTGEFDRDAEQVRRYVARHQTPYPVLVAGLADKAKASQQFPALDRVRAYPTTIFIDRHGRVRAIHSGFSGPATGKNHDDLRRRFEKLIEQLLDETGGAGTADGTDGGQTADGADGHG